MRLCFSADDMFFIVPAHLADAAFLRPGVLEEHTSLPLGWDLNQSARSHSAAVETYGTSLDRASFRLACGHIPFVGQREACAYGEPDRCPSSTRDICDYKAGKNDNMTRLEALCPNVTKPMKAGAKVEARLTARLHSRLVPVQIVRLPFKSALYGGHKTECSREEMAQLSKERDVLVKALRMMEGSDKCKDEHDEQCNAIVGKWRLCRARSPLHFC